jgi:hypothetical protein
MTYQEYIDAGITYRELTQPNNALACFGQAMILEPDSAAAFNNYGNTLRELGFPQRSIPFLEHACILDPAMSTAEFNLAVALLLKGDLRLGMKHYESRWRFEHLQGLLPQYSQPVWSGEDLSEKTILLLGEQGHGDIFQFCRFVANVKQRNPKKIYLQVTNTAVPVMQSSAIMQDVEVLTYNDVVENFDCWAMLMSLPVPLNLTYNTLNSPLQYINASAESVKQWQQRLGPKTQQRIGISWSGRRDTWLNRHKSVTFDNIVDLIKRNPEHQWVNLQADATEEENQTLLSLGVNLYPGTVNHWGDTAGLIHNLDLVIGVDTAVSHLSGALGRPTWIMLNHYAQDWRWLLNRNDSPWYPSAKLFRQSGIGDWNSVVDQLCQYLSWWKN